MPTTADPTPIPAMAPVDRPESSLVGSADADVVSAPVVVALAADVDVPVPVPVDVADCVAEVVVESSGTVTLK